MENYSSRIASLIHLKSDLNLKRHYDLHYFNVFHFLSPGYLDHVHKDDNSLIVLYCHEKLDPPALLRKSHF